MNKKYFKDLVLLQDAISSAVEGRVDEIYSDKVLHALKRLIRFLEKKEKENAKMWGLPFIQGTGTDYYNTEDSEAVMLQLERIIGTNLNYHKLVWVQECINNKAIAIKGEE